MTDEEVNAAFGAALFPAGTLPRANESGAAPPVTQREDASDTERELQSYEPTWEEIQAAARGDGEAEQALDIAWIASLPARLLKQIDGSFAVSDENAARALVLKSDKRARALKAQYGKDQKALERNARKRLGIKAKLEEDAV